MSSLKTPVASDLQQETGKWKGKSRGNPLGYRIFIFILKYLGVYAGYFVLSFVAFYYFLFAPKAFKASWFYHRKIRKQNLFRTLRDIYLGFYRFGQTLLDKVTILAGFSEKFTYHFDGEKHLRELAKEGEGAILISAHVGNWEIASQFLQKLNTPVNVVMFDNEYQQIKNLLENVMVKKQFNTIVIKDDFSHLLPIHKAIKNKEFICLHGDRFIERNQSRTEALDFLGQKARFPIGPFELTARFKRPYVFVYAFKETARHYHFFAFRGQENTGDFKTILKDYVTSLEKLVRRYPTQWFNFYEFWEKKKKVDSR